jgi:hypothetical protein
MAKPADWAVLVYISADEILANFAVETLKQLKLASGDQIVAAAQVDANGKRKTRRYRFGEKEKEDKEGAIANNEEVLDSPSRTGIADPQNLTDFIDWAYYDPVTDKPIAERFCVVAWGHGVELLLDEDRLRISGGNEVRVTRRYLTPTNLRKGLEGSKLVKGGKKFDIIGLDACSMSMLELASELPSCADFMVASQEDVPDVSFPYLKILEGLKEAAGGKEMEAKEVSKAIAVLYQRAYRDYISTPGSGVRAITLSSLNLNQVSTVTGPLKNLADELLKSGTDTKMRKAILQARSESRSFVFGLFVDLFNFCERLKEKLPSMTNLCSQIQEAIQEQEGGCVIRNATDERGKDCHGLSIYFPYRKDDPADAFQVLQALGPDDDRPVKGGNRPLKGGNRPLKERVARIAELEEDFDQLTGFKQTNWMKFIKQGWSQILIAEEPEDLDLRYSGQQVAKNLAA